MFVCAVLAVQNMDASGTVAKGQEIEFNALEGSLSMMSKGTWFFFLSVVEMHPDCCIL